MTVKNNSLGSLKKETASFESFSEPDDAVNSFINVYNARATFFSDSFIRKLKDGNRKALAELLKFPLSPNQMDLRRDFVKCLQAGVPEHHYFIMGDGKRLTMQELKRLVPEWSATAENALMESDPALADKLMSPAQWNAKSAFEVTFTSAMNELKEIRKTKLVSGSLGHYTKWIINPLKKAIEHVKEVNPPGNSLIGYGNRISLTDALKIAEGLPEEFHKLLAK